MIRNFKIGDVSVGPDHPPVIFAEIGSYFNGDAKLAKSMIDRVIDARKKVPHQPMVLKTEILDDAEICLADNTLETYSSKSGEIRQENYRDLIERKVMPLEQYVPLFSMCVERNIPFVVSVYDFKAADFAIKNGASALKIASSNVVHIPLIRYVAGLGLPMVIDSGRATIAEVHRAIDTARAAGCEDIVVQHSPDGHPAPPKAHNLRILETYAQAFNLPTGLSDHHVGLEMIYLSVALGASVIEKGVYDNPNELDQDISHTMGLGDLEHVLEMTYACWEALGSTERHTRDPIDWVIGTSQRQCLVANQDLEPGDMINLDTMRFAFPCKGIPVEDWDLVCNWVVDTTLKAGQPVQWENVKPKII